MQYYKLNLPTAIAHYKRGDLTSKGLLHCYLKIRLKDEKWKLRESQKDICDKLGMSKSAFYKALGRLREEGSIYWSVPGDTKFLITLSSQSTIEENQSTIEENQSTIEENQSTIEENDSPKPSRKGDSSASTDLYTNLDQLFSQKNLKKDFGESEILEAEVVPDISAESSQFEELFLENLNPSEGRCSATLTKTSNELAPISQAIDPFLVRRPRVANTDNCYPDGPWLDDRGKLRKDFLEFRAKQWVQQFPKEFPSGIDGDAMYRAKANVRAYWRNQPGRIESDWEMYEERFVACVNNAKQRTDSGMTVTIREQEELRTLAYIGTEVASKPPAPESQRLVLEEQNLKNHPDVLAAIADGRITLRRGFVNGRQTDEIFDRDRGWFPSIEEWLNR